MQIPFPVNNHCKKNCCFFDLFSFLRVSRNITWYKSAVRSEIPLWCAC